MVPYCYTRPSDKKGPGDVAPGLATALVLEKRPRFTDPNHKNGGWRLLCFRKDQATSKRSWFITLVHAATKSFTNFSLESAQA